MPNEARDASPPTKGSKTGPLTAQGARPYIGGQAVLEGVMMRAPRSFAVVVRRRDGSLLVRERSMTDEATGAGRWPLVRGIRSLVESLRLGGEALRFSAEQMERDLAADERAAAGAASGLGVLGAFGLTLFALATSGDGEAIASPTADDRGGPDGDGGNVAAADAPREKGRGPMGVMLVVAVLFLIALPQAIAEGINRLFHLGLPPQSAPFQVITGAVKLCVVVGYLVLIRRVPDIRRVFQYHGAEHKTISTYEAGEELTVANARAKTTLHPRCGTTFLVMVALVSILVFTAIGGLLPRIDTGNAIVDNLVFFVEKLPFLPLIVAITFEIQRLFAKHFTTGPLRAFLWPGFLVQKVTTIEPDDDQLEVALASLRATLFREHGESHDGGDIAFPTYDAILTAPRLRAA